MRQASGDLWRLPGDARCITVNGATRGDGTAVMGRGTAAQAAQRWPSLPRILGESIRRRGNHVTDVFMPGEPMLIAFPVKHHWRQRADLALIGRSCGELMDLADRLDLGTILLPRPGCGNGQLDWAEVGPAIAPLLDDRVTIVYAAVIR